MGRTNIIKRPISADLLYSKWNSNQNLERCYGNFKVDSKIHTEKSSPKNSQGTPKKGWSGSREMAFPIRHEQKLLLKPW